MDSSQVSLNLSQTFGAARGLNNCHYGTSFPAAAKYTLTNEVRGFARNPQGKKKTFKPHNFVSKSVFSSLRVAVPKQRGASVIDM